MRQRTHQPAKGVDLIDRRGCLRRLAGIGIAGAIMGHPVLSSKDDRGRGARPHRLKRIGIQIYTVRNLMVHDAERTIAGLAEIGFTEVELAGLYGMTARRMRELLDRHGLTAVSSHVGLRDMRQAWSQTLDDAATLGQHFLVCPSIDESERTVDGYNRVADDFNSLAERAQQHGLQFAYHNHMFEFAPVDGVVPYEILLTKTDPRLVRMEIDLMWMTKGGADPVAYFARYPGRFPMVHVKDMTAAGVMVDVGQGSINFPKIFAHADQAGIEHYFVEHDDPPAPLADARICYEYLRRLRF
jgi:sugar phosphate isomerase/epimerase